MGHNIDRCIMYRLAHENIAGLPIDFIDSVTEFIRFTPIVALTLSSRTSLSHARTLEVGLQMQRARG